MPLQTDCSRPPFNNEDKRAEVVEFHAQTKLPKRYCRGFWKTGSPVDDAV